MITQPRAMGIFRPKLSATHGLFAQLVCLSSWGAIPAVNRLHYGDRNQAADLVEGTKQTELASLGVIKELLPRVEVLNRVEEHAVSHATSVGHHFTSIANGDLPIVTGGGRGNAENQCVKVELAQTGILEPVDFLEVWGFFLSLDDSLTLGLLLRKTFQETHCGNGSKALDVVFAVRVRCFVSAGEESKSQSSLRLFGQSRTGE